MPTLTAPEYCQKAEDLREIQAQILALVEQARETLRGTPMLRQAEAYWLAHIEGACQKINRYDVTMDDTLEELDAAAFPDAPEDSGEEDGGDA